MLKYKVTPLDLAIHTLTDPVILTISTFVYLVLGYYLFEVNVWRE